MQRLYLQPCADVRGAAGSRTEPEKSAQREPCLGSVWPLGLLLPEWGEMRATVRLGYTFLNGLMYKTTLSTLSYNSLKSPLSGFLRGFAQTEREKETLEPFFSAFASHSFDLRVIFTLPVHISDLLICYSAERLHFISKPHDCICQLFPNHRLWDDQKLFTESRSTTTVGKWRWWLRLHCLPIMTDLLWSNPLQPVCRPPCSPDLRWTPHLWLSKTLKKPMAITERLAGSFRNKQDGNKR